MNTNKERFHKGEKVAVVGQLTIGSTVQTDWAMCCQLRTPCGTIIRRLPMPLDSGTSTYSCVIDTTDLVGSIKIRFEATMPSGDKVVTDEDTTIKIYE